VMCSAVAVRMNSWSPVITSVGILRRLSLRSRSNSGEDHLSFMSRASIALALRMPSLVISWRPGIAPPRFLPSFSSVAEFRSTPEVLQEEISSRYSGKFVIVGTLTCTRFRIPRRPFRGGLSARCSEVTALGLLRPSIRLPPPQSNSLARRPS
jgi:hypothetical protein